MDAFSAQIVRFVREMPDEALLELVKQKLGVLGVAAARSGKRRAPKPTAGGARKVEGPRRRAPSNETERASPRKDAAAQDRRVVLDNVERIVKAGTGLSASDVARTAGIPQSRAAAALRELKLGKRIFQGGDRRFARYAGDARTAEQASTTARKNAKGPQTRAARRGEGGRDGAAKPTPTRSRARAKARPRRADLAPQPPPP